MLNNHTSVNESITDEQRAEHPSCWSSLEAVRMVAIDKAKRLSPGLEAIVNSLLDELDVFDAKVEALQVIDDYHGGW